MYNVFLISSYLSIGRLQEVNNKRKFQMYCATFKKWAQSLSRGGHLQEIPNKMIWLENIWYFVKLFTEERLSQLELWL